MKLPDLRHLDGHLPPEMEKAYRQFYIKADITVALIMLGFFCVLVTLFAYNDYALFGLTPTFYYLAALRIVYLAYFIALMIYLGRNQNPSRFDLSLLISLILGFFLVAFIDLSRPSNNLGSFAVDIIVVLIIYLGVPIRLLFRAGAALFLSLTEILIFVFFRELPPGAAEFTLVVVLLAANVIGISASARLYAFRRGQFKALSQQAAAAAELRKSTDLLNETGEMAKVGGWELNVDTLTMRGTDEAYRIHGLDPGGLLSLDEGIALYVPEYRATIYEAVQDTILTGEPFDLEVPLITAGDKWHWVHFVGRGYRENGKITRVNGTMQDITERKIAEDEVKKTADQWQSTFDAITDLVSIQDSNFKLVRVNKAYAEAFKMKPEELIGRSCFDVVHGTSCPIDNCPQKRSMQTKTSVTEEIFEPRLGIYIEVSCSPIFNEQGELEGTVHIVQDITQRKRDEAERMRVAERIEDLYNNAPNGYHSVDKDGFYILINDTELSWLGYTREEVIGRKKFSDFLTPQSLKAYEKSFPVFKDTGRVKDHAYDIVHKNGTITSVLISATAVKDTAGNYVMSRSTLYDVTEIKRLQKMADETERKYRIILEEMNDAYFEIDLNGIFMLVNNTLCRMLLVDRNDLIGASFRKFTSEKDLELIRSAFRQLNEEGKASKGLVFEVIRKDGSTFYIEISVSFLKDAKGDTVGYRCVGRDVTKRIELQNKIAEMAMHDSLTTLPNRSLLYDHFNMAQGQAERGNRKMAVMELDLDHFKLINDTMGHAAGDDLLRATALRLKDVVRKSDTVARLGGDEFVVLVPEISRIDDATATAKKILAAFNQPFTLNGNEFTVTTSIGIAIYPDNGATIDKLLEAADQAMYDIKGQGRNNYKLAGEK